MSNIHFNKKPDTTAIQCPSCDARQNYQWQKQRYCAHCGCFVADVLPRKRAKNYPGMVRGSG